MPRPAGPASTMASVTAATAAAPPRGQPVRRFRPSAPSAATAEEAGHEPGLPYVLAPVRNAAIAAGLLRPKAWPTLFVELNHTNPSSP